MVCHKDQGCCWVPMNVGVMSLLQDNLNDFSTPKRHIQALGWRRLTRVLMVTEERMETLWLWLYDSKMQILIEDKIVLGGEILWKDAGLLIPPFPECIWGKSSRKLNWSLKLNTGLLIPPFPECILREVTWTCVTCELETYKLYMLLELCITYKKA